MCIHTDTCGSHGEPHTYMHTHIHIGRVYPLLGRLRENEGGMETERKRDTAEGRGSGEGQGGGRSCSM